MEIFLSKKYIAGYPTVSILGSFLFIIVINDFPLLISPAPVLYADDTLKFLHIVIS